MAIPSRACYTCCQLRCPSALRGVVARRTARYVPIATAPGSEHMPQCTARLLRTSLLGITLLVLFGCGLSSTVVQGGSTATAVATATATATATKTPPPTPGHLLVTIIPNPKVCSQQQTGCAPYVCHDGMTCTTDWACTSPAWPTIQLSNSGQASLTWTATLTQYSPAPWSLSATQGTLAGGASTNLTVTNGPAGGGVQVVFHGPGQTVTLVFSCGAG